MNGETSREEKTPNPSSSTPASPPTDALSALKQWETVTGSSASAPEGNVFMDGFNAGAASVRSAMDTELEVLKYDLERARSARIHTQDWYAAHYGKLEDWARKRLPEPWVNEFFSCVANGTWGHDDVGEPYMSQVGRIVPSGYLKMETAVEQLLHDQTTRAENAEMALASVRAASTGSLIMYCHLCGNYFKDTPDGHGLGECVELCEICLQHQADIDTRDVGKTAPCAPCRRVLQLAEALRAMLDIAPFAKNTPDAEIHGRATLALHDRLFGEPSPPVASQKGKEAGQ